MMQDSNDEGFWRVYRSEWVVEYVSDADGEEGTRECMRKFLDGYRCRVQDGDWRIVAWSETDPGGWPCMLEVHLPVMKGEYRNQKDADVHVRKTGGTVVREGSPEETGLLHRGAEMTRKESR